MRILIPLAIGVLTLSLAACSSSTQETVGSFIGGGSKPEAADPQIVALAQPNEVSVNLASAPVHLQSKRPVPMKSVGGISESRVAHILAAGDTPLAVETELHTLERGTANIPYGWRNASNGHMGIVVAGPVRHIGGRECRSIQHTLKFASPPQVVFGTGCRLATGGWQIM